MNNEDALLQIQSIPEKIWNQLSPSDKDAMEMAFNALEKQIPVKPLRRKATFDRSIKKLYCPVCKKYLGYENYRTRSVSNQSGDYCDCGQKILWR